MVGAALTVTISSDAPDAAMLSRMNSATPIKVNTAACSMQCSKRASFVVPISEYPLIASDAMQVPKLTSSSVSLRRKAMSGANYGVR